MNADELAAIIHRHNYGFTADSHAECETIMWNDIDALLGELDRAHVLIDRVASIMSAGSSSPLKRDLAAFLASSVQETKT